MNTPQSHRATSRSVVTLSIAAGMMMGCAGGPAPEIEVNGARYELIIREDEPTDFESPPEGTGIPELVSDESTNAPPLHEWAREELANALRPTIVHSNGELYAAAEPAWEAADRVIAERGVIREPRVVPFIERPRGRDTDDANARVESIIIGADGRTRINPTTVNPNDGVIRLELFGTSSGVSTLKGTCTGSYIGPWTVVTAAHCILQAGSLTTNRIIFKPAQNGSTLPFGSMDCRNDDVPTNNNIAIAFPAGWTGGSGNEQFDYAVIDTYPCQVAPVSNIFNGYVVDSASATYTTAGYPGDRCPTAPGSNTFQCGMSGPAYQNDYRIETEHIDTFAGQSGMPWWRVLSGNEYVAAIHTGSRSFVDIGMCGFSPCVRNYGRRVDTAVESFIQANSYDF